MMTVETEMTLANFARESGHDKSVLKLLTPNQKEKHKQICGNILEQTEINKCFLEGLITCNETWIFQYDPETKR